MTARCRRRSVCCFANSLSGSIPYFRKMKSAIPTLIGKYPQWKAHLLILQQCALECGLEETIKWGMPTFTKNGRNIVAIGAFKAYAGLWFFNGSFLADKDRVLINAQQGKTRALRQWRFTEGEKIPKAKVKAYLKEAIRNEENGLAIRPKKTTRVSVPMELKEALGQHPEAAELFKALSPAHRREYAEHVAEAKQEATRVRRAEKCIRLILQKDTLHGKYK